VPVSRASSSTASCPAIPTCRPSSSIVGPASGSVGAGSRKTSLITMATCSACSPPDELISSAVTQTAASAARRSARSCSLPSISSVSFLRPASASCSTSHTPRASAMNTTPIVCRHCAAFRNSAPASPPPAALATQRLQPNDESWLQRFGRRSNTSPNRPQVPPRNRSAKYGRLRAYSHGM
jgi:hypothetical protein